MVVEVDGLLVILLGDALIDAVEAQQVWREHEGGAEAIDVVCELQVVPGVRVPNHDTCWEEGEKRKKKGAVMC